jgi:serine/threonine protein kinase
LTIKNSAIELQEKVGEGEFGIVFKGQWKVSKGKAVTVALKTLKSTTSDDDKVKLFQEAAIMGQFMHPSIAAMYGCVNEPHVRIHAHKSTYDASS